mgnify:CR=1 FL=1
MDIKKKIDELVTKVKNDPKFMEEFKKDPVKAVESVIGVDLPDDQINPIIEGVKAKITADNIGNVIGGLFGKK